MEKVINNNNISIKSILIELSGEMTKNLKNIINTKKYYKSLIFTRKEDISNSDSDSSISAFIFSYMLFMICIFPEESQCVSQILRQLIKIIYSLRLTNINLVNLSQNNNRVRDVTNIVLNILSEIIHKTTVIRNVF